jgi:cell division protein ZapD
VGTHARASLLRATGRIGDRSHTRLEHVARSRLTGLGRWLENSKVAEPHLYEASAIVVYEQPLSERIRAFLRLEHLLEKANQLARREDHWSSRATVDALIDTLTLASRMDLKTELIKELERQLATLEALPASPQLDTERLQEVVAKIRSTLSAIKATDTVFGQALKSNELMNAVRQRSSIPAGACDFDLPALRYWLNLAHEHRERDLNRWLNAFHLVRDGVDLSLSLVRSSASATQEVAVGGFFQRTLDAQQPYSLVRVLVDNELACFTEISAGKHRFTVRFMKQARAEDRSSQTEEDVAFRLACCGL